MQMTIASDVTKLIGHTPIVRLSRFGCGCDCGESAGLAGGIAGVADPVAAVDVASPVRGEILAKLEERNPGGSVKDRTALYMIEDAERRGELRPGGVIIEPTSGNTGVGLAMIAAVRDYRLVLTMPDSMSVERRRLLAAYGAEIVLTPGAQGMAGAVDAARSLKRDNPSWFMPLQFENPSNPRAHEETTAAEILHDLDRSLEAFVAGIGTGGTITGVGRALKRAIPGVRVVGVEPAESAVLSGGESGPHGIQGIGAGFVPDVLDMSVVDEIVAVSSPQACAAARELARSEGILVGISSGAAAVAALEVARELGPGARVLALFPDTGERYLSVQPIPYRPAPGGQQRTDSAGAEGVPETA
jgi:cysteine synthase A